jgi:hypothetical protein
VLFNVAEALPIKSRRYDRTVIHDPPVVRQWVECGNRGFAKREVSNVTIGGRQVKIVRMQITAAGRNAIAD